MAEQDKQNIVTPLVMNLDGEATTLSPEEMAFVLNGVSEFDGAGTPFISNIGANEFTGISFPPGFIPNGRCKITDDVKCVFLVNEAKGLSQIGVIQNGKYSVRVEDAELNFKLSMHIQAKCKIMFNGHWIIYWTDNYNPMRWIDLDAIPYVKEQDANGNIVVTSKLDIDQIKIFKNYNTPFIDILEVTGNGVLKTGGYFITGQYANARGNGYTACFPLSNKIPIYRDSLSSAYDFINGDASNLPSGKSIKIKISQQDLSFTHLNIIAIRVIDGSISPFYVTTLPIAQNEYVYTGAGTEIPVLLEDVLIPATVYNTAKTVEEADGSLVWGNLTSKPKVNFQHYVNGIQIQWQAYRTKANNNQKSHKNPVFAAYFQSYRRDEVIPLGIVFELTDGSDTDAWPLVGRRANLKSNSSQFGIYQDVYGQSIHPNEWDTRPVDSSNDIYENQNLPRWKAYNTATIEGDLLSAGQEEGLSYYGEMSYWESTDRYPTNKEVWGDLAGQPIRHPKMPDATLLPLVETPRVKINISFNLQLDKNIIGMHPYTYHLGIRLPNIDEVLNSMPAEIRSTIRGWRIVRADRTFNKSVVANGIIMNCLGQHFNVYDDDRNYNTPDQLKDLRIYPNYPLNDRRPDPYILGTDDVRLAFMKYSKHNKLYFKDTFTFISPDTSLKKTMLQAGELKVNSEVFGYADCYHTPLKPYPLFKQKGDKLRQSAMQLNVIGWYNNAITPKIGNVRRRLDESMYIPFNSQVSGGNAGRIVWNKGRESTVLLKLNKDLDDPTTVDASRSIITNEDTIPNFRRHDTIDYGSKFKNFSDHISRSTSAYYVTLKQNIANQYGTLNDIKFVETGYNNLRYKSTNAIFGGDTYVGMFACKRQMPFYHDIQKWTDATDGCEGANFEATMNVPYTQYYYKNTQNDALAQSNMMMDDEFGSWDLFGTGDGDGKDLGVLTMVVNGIPVFWTESDVNLELRYNGSGISDTFYPNLHEGALSPEEWMGVSNIDKDNSYNNNIDLSGFNDLNSHKQTDVLFEPGNLNVNTYATRVIKSLRSQPEDLNDNWQIYKPLDYYDFVKSRGALVDIRYIGTHRTLFRFEQSAFITQLQNTIETSNSTIVLGSGRLFSTEPDEPVFSGEVSYTGTSSQWAFDVCEFGAFFVNANRGKVFNLASGIKEISNQKAAQWFNDNLPFKINKQIAGVSTDSPYNPNGIGIHSVFDNKNKIWLLTKKDYELVNPALASQFEYKDGSFYYNGQVVSLQDKSLFVNRSFTIGYSPILNGWISFYSFIPDMYLTENTTFSSIVSKDAIASVYRHGSKYKYLEFYGERKPFIVEYATKADGVSTTVHAHSTFISKSYVFQDEDLVNIENRSFNKGIVFNDTQTSGLLNLIIQDENDLSTLYSQLSTSVNSKDVALRYRDRRWNFSDYFDIVKGPGAVFTKKWSAIQKDYFIDKVLNNANLDYTQYMSVGAAIRGQFTKTRLILDNATDLKLLFKIGIESTRASIA